MILTVIIPINLKLLLKKSIKGTNSLMFEVFNLFLFISNKVFKYKKGREKNYIKIYFLRELYQLRMKQEKECDVINLR